MYFHRLFEDTVDPNPCPRCGNTSPLSFSSIVFHDLHCWGLRTTLFNIWALLTWPDSKFEGR